MNIKPKPPILTVGQPTVHATAMMPEWLRMRIPNSNKGKFTFCCLTMKVLKSVLETRNWHARRAASAKQHSSSWSQSKSETRQQLMSPCSYLSKSNSNTESGWDLPLTSNTCWKQRGQCSHWPATLTIYYGFLYYHLLHCCLLPFIANLLNGDKWILITIYYLYCLRLLIDDSNFWPNFFANLLTVYSKAALRLS